MPPKKKKLAAIVKLQIKAGMANPAPPVGPALGQHGVNIMEFCKAYNAATESQRGDVVPVEISIYEDRSFDFKLKTPPAARLLLKAAGVEKGSGTPHTTKVASVTTAQLRRSRRSSRSISTRTTSTPRPRSSPAPPGRWGSPSPTDLGRTVSPRSRVDHGGRHTKRRRHAGGIVLSCMINSAGPHEDAAPPQ